ncbi:MAG: SLBB domain-containing protein [Candidatus Delongbacteria bacterium]|nr:SLBB domain-containing protein [Candidatus Delongbacteria bacterium]
MGVSNEQKASGVSPYRSDNQSGFQIIKPQASTDQADIRKTLQEIKELLLNQRSLYTSISGGVIDSNFILGPGDVCLILLSGSIDQIITPIINTDGMIMIPGIGLYNAGGKPYHQVKHEITDFIQQRARNAQIEFSLISPRKIKVYLSGEVKKPGMYPLEATDRLTALMAYAGGHSPFANLKRIELRYSNAYVDTVNYEGFIFDGKPTGNPLLVDGLIVYVPPVSLTQDKIILKGQSKYNGFYNLYQGETLSQLIRRIGLNSEDVPLEHIFIQSDSGLLDVNILTEDYILKNGDVIILGTQNQYVYLSGNIRYAGAYPYIPGMTVTDYIGIAGGFSPSSITDKFVLTRDFKSQTYKIQGFNQSIMPGDQIYIKTKFKYTLYDALSIMSTISSVVLAYLAATRSN